MTHSLFPPPISHSIHYYCGECGKYQLLYSGEPPRKKEEFTQYDNNQPVLITVKTPILVGETEQM